MIYIDQKKLTVDGVDVYPDHESPSQFWYLPGTVQLAEREGRKVLSYLWYTDSKDDANGTGMLNFEVNTAVSEKTLERIRSRIVSEWEVDEKKSGKIRLATVPYNSGSVNFSVLGPVVAQAANARTDPAVLYQSPEQLVWNAGSSSLVGDNAAVCSVRFTKEGKLAAAMKAVLQNRAKSMAAIYRLEFLAMRPSVTFKVTGSFKKAIQDFQLSLGAQIPLEALVLDLGFQAQWRNVLQSSELKIEVVDYTGAGGEQAGRKLAESLLLTHLLKNFFEVQLDQGANTWTPLSEAPKVDAAVQKAKDVEEGAAAQVEKDQADSSQADKDEAVKEIVKAATIFIPKVNIRAAYYEGKQVNTLDFFYSEKKATVMTALPQAVIGLSDKDDPEAYIVQVNRAQDPFGLPFPVMTSVPNAQLQTELGLQTLNVQARYPAGAPRDRQSALNYSINDGKEQGVSTFPFQYDSNGSSAVDYSAEFVFQPMGEWQGDSFHYSLNGTSDNGLIKALPNLVAEFLTITIGLSQDFVWEGADQAVVTLTSAKWKGEKRVVFQRGKDADQTLKLRCSMQFKDEPVTYQVELRQGGRSVRRDGSFPMQDNFITVNDRFAGHTPVFFEPRFTTGFADVSLRFEQGDWCWEDNFTLEAGDKRSKRVVPSLQAPRRESELVATYEVTFDSGQTLTGMVKGGSTVRLTPTA